MSHPQVSLPSSWSSLTWQQLCDMWAVKMRYGGNADVAVVAAMLALLETGQFVPESGRSGYRVERGGTDPVTGEQQYLFIHRRSGKGLGWVFTPRELAYYAHEQLRWFQFPYGDPGEKAERDSNGKVTKEGRDPVRGCVSPMRDALVMPVETLTIEHGTLNIKDLRRPWWKRMVNGRWSMFNKTFTLPQVACNNLTWQQYRSLQAITPQLFAEGIGEREALGLQAQFLAHILTPRSLALLDTAGGSIRFRPHYEYRYNTERADGLVRWWERQLTRESRRDRIITTAAYHSGTSAPLSVLFHICFQAYQTALSYYAASYPLLFADSGKSDPLRDALTGEVGTINTIMKYAGYAEQQQVYDSNLPFVLDILNTMTKEAKEIEKMNSKINRKKH